MKTKYVTRTKFPDDSLYLQRASGPWVIVEHQIAICAYHINTVYVGGVGVKRGSGTSAVDHDIEVTWIIGSCLRLLTASTPRIYVPLEEMSLAAPLRLFPRPSLLLHIHPGGCECGTPRY